MSELVGIPWVAGGRSYEGADCWGVVKLAAKALFRFTLPDYQYVPEPMRGTFIDAASGLNCWTKINVPAAGAVVVLAPKGWNAPTHVGIMVDNSRMLHSTDSKPNGSSRLNTIDQIEKVYTVIGYYKWQR